MNQDTSSCVSEGSIDRTIWSRWVGRAQEEVGVVRTGRAEEPAPDSECEVAPQQMGLEVVPDKMPAVMLAEEWGRDAGRI